MTSIEEDGPHTPLSAEELDLAGIEVTGVFGDIANQLGGTPCVGHMDFAAGTWTYHRERECPELAR